MKYLVLLVSILVVGFSGSLWAEEGGTCSFEAAEQCEVINSTCPVMGGEVDQDTPFKVEYEGQTIGFCCAGCIDAFNAAPEKYLEIIKQERIIECPECGAEINLGEKCCSLRQDE